MREILRKYPNCEFGRELFPAAPPVDAAGFGVGVGGEDFLLPALKLQAVDIIDPRQVALHMGLPDALPRRFHGAAAVQRSAGLIIRTGGIQQHPHCRRRGRPQLEYRVVLLPGRPMRPDRLGRGKLGFRLYVLPRFPVR